MKKYLFPLVLFLLSLVALYSLIISPFYTSHDGFTHTARIAAYTQTIISGQFPPRWITNFNGGLGSPMFIYSYPLVYMLGAVMHFIGVSYENSFRFVMGLGYVLSGLAMYWWLSNRFGKLPGFVGAIFYLWAPYRLLDIYVRGALAENFAYIFLPLILLGIDKKWFLFLSLSTTGLLLSHNVVSAMFLPVAFLWALINRRILWAGFAMALGLLASSYIYLPDLFERGYIHFDTGISYWKEHFLYLPQFIRSKWDYGFDFPGYINDGMSFELGLANWLVLGLSSLYVFFRRKLEPSVALFLLIFGVIILLVIENPLSWYIWTYTPVLKTIVDFPWRFIGLVTLIIGFLGAYLVKKTHWSVGVLLVIAALVANRNFIRVNEIVTFPDKSYEQYSGAGTATSNEYLPFWHTDIKVPGQSERLENIDNNYTFVVINNLPSEFTFKVQGVGEGRVKINRFYFPITKIYYNNQELIENKDWLVVRHKTDNLPFDDTGTMVLTISSLGGKYSVKYFDTNLRKTANLITVLSIVAIVLIAYVRKKI